MKNTINRLLSTYTKYDLISLKQALTIWKQDTLYSISTMIDAAGKFIRNHLILFSIILAILAYFSREYIILGCLGLSFLLITLLTELKEREDFKKEVFYMGVKAEDIRLELDNFINECLEEYLIYNSYDGMKSINSDGENKIRTELVNLVSSRLSPILFKKLSIRYKEESIYDLMASRINIIVMNYVITTNTNLDKERMETEAARQNKGQYTSTLNYFNTQDQIL